MSREQLLGVRVNNMLLIGLGLITIAYVMVVVSTLTAFDTNVFSGLVVIGALM